MWRIAGAPPVMSTLKSRLLPAEVTKSVSSLPLRAMP
jgi:hypothetical protein